MRPQLGFRRSEPHRLTARTPAAGICFKNTVTARPAFVATPVSGKMPCRDVIPIAANEDRATRMTVGSLARGVVNIAGIDVMEARIRCDPPCFAQRLGRCRRSVGQLPVRMKGREVERHVGPESIHHPGALCFNFSRRIVLARDEQSGDLKPNVGLMLEIFEGLKYGANLPEQRVL